MIVYNIAIWPQNIFVDFPREIKTGSYIQNLDSGLDHGLDYGLDSIMDSLINCKK